MIVRMINSGKKNLELRKEIRSLSWRRGRMASLSLILLTVSSFVNIVIGDNSINDSVQRTLPAYAIAFNAKTTLNSSMCALELDAFKEAIDLRKLWALKMLDSSGEPQSGFIYGNNYWLGSRSQCVDTTNEKPFVLLQKHMENVTKYRDSEEEFPPFGLNYFVAHIHHNSTLQYHVRLPHEDLLTLGLCLPATCTTDHLSSILNKIFQKRTLMISNLYSADFKLESIRDLKNDRVYLINGRIITVFLIIAFTTILMICGTIYDVIFYQKYLKAKKAIRETAATNNNTYILNGPNQTVQNPESLVNTNFQRPTYIGDILRCFSIYTNTKMMFSTKLDSNSVPQIHGLRFLGMVWIIIIHTIFYMADFTDNKPWSWRSSDGFTSQIISNATLSVDTFFFLGGFLISYLYYKPRPTSKKENDRIDYKAKVFELLGAVLKRFIRLTPAYMMMIGIAEINSAYYGHISPFYMTERPQDVCGKYWWRNLLYINNFFGRETMCLSWSWYLSNDMQFFIIGTFLVILSSIYFYTAVTILLFILFGSTVLTGYISYIYAYVPTLDQQYHMLDLLYDPPWTRIGPYIIGLATGYLLVKLKKKLIIRKRTLVILWLLGSGCNLSVLFGLYERQLSLVTSAVYVALSRTVWGIGISWLLIACCTNNAGFVNAILSFRGWIPLSRMTYCAYLINPFIITSIYLQNESALHVNALFNGTTALGNLVATYACSYVYSLMMESPYVLLMRLLTKPRKQYR